ncbi:hypothetical protein Arno162_85 [Pectobacterium phage Arno162]|uniref:Tail sheath protein n=1 Tax=Pectobacterium phage Arno162 TaxID=2500577 RepID=A0A679A2M5_9CAUD|nr:hypothetical protein Arno162_85 [Pectobacterium phage Arno162]
MAEWLPIVQVDITLNTTGSTREGFGLPLFVANTDAFPERVKYFTSLESVLALFDENSAVYKAAVKLWSQTPKVSQLSVARRDMQYLLSIPDAPAAGTLYSVQLTGGDGIASTISVTASAGDTAQTVFTNLVAAINADPTFGTQSGLVKATQTGIGALARLLLESANPAANFLRASVASGSAMTVAPSVADTPAQFLSRIQEEDDSWYFLAIEDRTVATVEGVSVYIGASTSRKLFFTATDLAAALVGTNLPNATDWVARQAQANVPRTVILWHQTAASDYPELAYIGYGAPYDAGSISWGNAQLSGVTYSTQASGRPLNSGQKAALETRNCNYIEFDGGVSVVRHGKVSGGEWIDVIRGTDWMRSDLTISLRDLLVNQKGGKITYDDRGITRVRQVIESSLERAVARNFLESYQVNVPRASSISTELKRQRILKDISFTGILAGAINDVNLQGSVSYE